jgi:hypothetical protein
MVVLTRRPRQAVVLVAVVVLTKNRSAQVIATSTKVIATRPDTCVITCAEDGQNCVNRQIIADLVEDEG